jgi:hypothetical protein
MESRAEEGMDEKIRSRRAKEIDGEPWSGASRAKRVKSLW